ncbi:MAG: RimK family alpha-L-glutamate ligase [Planctomycetes bacterium]|nr:RimK family alpha-L-glutamate ligase [Planctomycetota bacterium]NBY02852.1 RimK family alpha-L-glutamate ligase [Planctomycetota bacterium]
MIFNIMGGKEGWHVKDLLRAAQSLGFKANVTDFRLITHSLIKSSNQAFEEADCTIIRTMPPGSLEQVVFRMDVLHALQRKGKKVLNPPRALESAVDKFLASELLQSHGLDIPNTFCCQDSDTAMEAFERFGKDIVVKPLFGAEGRGILRIQDEQLAWRVFRAIEKIGGVIYLQPYIKHPGWDLRIFILGGKVLGGMKRTAPQGAWMTNVAQGGKGEPYKLNSDLEEIGIKASKAVGAEIAGVDLILDEHGKWLVLEVNAVPGWKAFAPVTGIDIAREILIYANHS